MDNFTKPANDENKPQQLAYKSALKIKINIIKFLKKSFA